MKRPRRILIAGGGTGGHVFPAISIAQALKKKDPELEILFVGAKDKLEMEKVPEAGFNIIGLPVAGFQRKLSVKNFTFFLKLWKSMRKSKIILREFMPDVAVGVGGYASGPVLRTAEARGIPTAIQEQNSYAGITNRLLARKAAKIFVAYEGMEKYFPAEKIVMTGNPVRKDIISAGVDRKAALEHFGLIDEKPVVLVIGGSLGAGTINKSILDGLDDFGNDIQLIWQTGKLYYHKIIEQLQDKKGKNIVIQPFISRMEYAYACADLIISRAGAGTISELALAGKPVILVPSPNVAEDHQTKNAMALAVKEAALHVADKNAERQLVKKCMELLKDEEKRGILANNIRSVAMPDSADNIADEIIKLI